MQYFNTHNSEVEYIKDVLRSNYIPTVRVFNSTSNLQPSFKKSGVELKYAETVDMNDNTISEEINSMMFKNESIIYDNSIRVGEDDGSDSLMTKKVKYLTNYEFGKYYRNLTTNYISNKNYYDSGLHEWLGRYLRAYRDYYHIDVMNFYNCFSSRYITEFSLPVPHSGSNDKINGLVFNPYDSNYRVAAFPILWDVQYKVKFYSTTVSNTLLQAVYFNGSSVLGAAEYYGIGGVSKDTNDRVNVKYEPITHTATGNEFTVTIGSELVGKDIEEDDIERERKYRYSRQNLLYLFMQYPANVTGPIVVIEQPKFTNAIGNELLNLPSTTKKQVAFTDILLEYLTGAVITPADPIAPNIHRVQKIVSSQAFFNAYGVGGPKYEGVDLARTEKGYPRTYTFPSGVFDEVLHQILYKAFFNNGRSAVINGLEDPVTNFIGYVDSDIERRLNSLSARNNLDVEV